MAPAALLLEMADENEPVEEHKTSLAVWDLASPVVVGRPGKMKVGAKCSAGCTLTDHEVEVFDAFERAGEDGVARRFGRRGLALLVGVPGHRRVFYSPSIAASMRGRRAGVSPPAVGSVPMSS